VTFRKGAIARAEIIPLYASNNAKWTLEGLTIKPRHAEPQLLAGPFAAFALDEFVDFAKQVPKAQETSFIRVGDRMFVDLGDVAFSTSSSVYESLPPDRHTMTRSPSAIMR
jgi:hypothetical protein